MNWSNRSKYLFYVALVTNIANMLVLFFLFRRGGDLGAQSPYYVTLFVIWVGGFLLACFMPKEQLPENTRSNTLNAILIVMCTPIPLISACSVIQLL